MKKFGATSVKPEPGKPQGFEETGSVSRDIPGIGFSAQSSTFPNHTYEMDADNLKEIGHKGFTVDAQAMTAVLFDFATHPELPRRGEEGVRRHQGAVRRVSGGAEENLHRPDGPGSKTLTAENLAIAEHSGSAVSASSAGYRTVLQVFPDWICFAKHARARV